MITREETAGFVRHTLTTFGGYVTASGVVSESDWQLIAGAVATLVGFGWSVAQKKGWIV